MRVPKTLTFEMRLCASLSVEDEFYVHKIILKKDYHNNGFTFSLTLKQNLGVTHTRNGLLANGVVHFHEETD